MIMVGRGLFEETTTFMALGSCGFKPLNWGKSSNAQDKPGQPNEHSVRLVTDGHQPPAQLCRPSLRMPRNARNASSEPEAGFQPIASGSSCGSLDLYLYGFLPWWESRDYNPT